MRSTRVQDVFQFRAVHWTISCLLLILLPLAATPAWSAKIILMIGDGMGVAQLSASYYQDGRLAMHRMPVGGLVSTESADKRITDSAAAGTALATGIRTNNGMISQSPQGDTLKTVMEHAWEQGWATGIVATCRVTHATPAAFVTHQPSRYDYSQIAWQIARRPLTVLFGYGLGDFLPKGQDGSLREDQLDLLPLLSAHYRQQAWTAEDFAGLGQGSAVALLTMDHPGGAPRPQPDLAAMTSRALAVLDAESSHFFLLIEGSQIDWACHGADEPRLLAEMRDFDRAVARALDFQSRNEDVLLLVTADHETGGLVLSKEPGSEDSPQGLVFCSEHHTAAMVPLLAAGKDAAEFGGLHSNAKIGQLLIQRVLANDTR